MLPILLSQKLRLNRRFSLLNQFQDRQLNQYDWLALSTAATQLAHRLIRPATYLHLDLLLLYGRLLHH